MIDRYVIYGLVDPLTNQLRYVGKSCQGLKRARSHAYPGCLKRDRSRCGNWIRSLLKAGHRYRVVIIQRLQEAEILCEAEKFWIKYFRTLGFPLTNLTDGGEGRPGFKVSAETREKLRKANLGNKNALGKTWTYTPEVRAEVAERARRRSADASIRAKISASLKGRKNASHSEKTRAKISASLKGHPAFPGSGRPKGSFVKKIRDADGNLYCGLEAVALKFGVSASQISHILKGRRPNRWGLRQE